MASTPKLTAQDKQWMAEDDCRTLAMAQEIMADSNRMAAAQKVAAKMAAEAKARSDAMAKIAGSNSGKGNSKKTVKKK